MSFTRSSHFAGGETEAQGAVIGFPRPPEQATDRTARESRGRHLILLQTVGLCTFQGSQTHGYLHAWQVGREVCVKGPFAFSGALLWQPTGTWSHRLVRKILFTLMKPPPTRVPSAVVFGFGDVTSWAMLCCQCVQAPLHTRVPC